MWKKKKIRFTDKKHSVQGMISSGFGAASLLLLAASIASAYRQSGQAGKWTAIAGFLSMLCACAGFVYGVRGVKEEDSYPLFPYLGCGLSVVLLAVFVSIYILGW